MNKFKKSLASKIQFLENLPSAERSEDDCIQALESLEEAYNLSIELRIPEATEILGKPGPVIVRLLEALNSIPDKSDTYSVMQAAEHLGVSKEAIYERCGDGRMPCTRIGRRIVITPEQLASYQSESEQPSAGLRHLS